MNDGSGSRRRIVSLPTALDHCRHGRDVRRITAEQSLNGWLVWGHYRCPECRRTALHDVSDRPDEASIGSRNLPIYDRQ